MKQYKVIAITDWWSTKRLAKKSEDAINKYSADGWEFVNLQYRPWGVCTMITFSKNR